MTTRIDFFEFDADNWEEIPMGTVTIDGSAVTSDNPDLLDIIEPGTSEEAAKALFGDWSNGYIGSRVQESMVASTGFIGFSTETLETGDWRDDG